MDPALTIPLARGEANSTVVAVNVASDGAWHLTTEALGTDARGHMHLLDGPPSVVLAAPMQVVATSGSRIDLSAAQPIPLDSGAGSVTLPVVFDQAVGPADPPGSYGIEVVFSAISGF